HLTGRLGLTDAKGQPLCARVRPPLISWSATTP
ncbi:monooxygenase, partial [Streptomyces sp. SID8455]|nr:monooxygenase [Streptomyces sp. SID8455]